MVPPRSTPGDPRSAHIRFQRVAPPLTAFATDLDRTLLRPGGAPTRTAREALRTARGIGLKTLLVSGRPHSQLVAFARAYREFDGMVAENGAVVEAPVGSVPTVVGRGGAGRLRRRLEGEEELHCEFGEVVISVPWAERPDLIARVAGLPVHLVRNVGRVMVLPRGVSKRTGTRLAMRRLGLGGSAYAAIGDAENDLDLLAGSRLSGAVGNARPAVRSAADYVCRERFDRGVLEFVQGPLADRVGARSRRPVTGVRRGTARALR